MDLESAFYTLYVQVGCTIIGLVFGFIAGLFWARKEQIDDQIEVQEVIRPSNHSN